ncbi:MAG: hypothetical protein KatS3mg110_1334 [Pirellulaceae bacterium]|nr:MAG: hypothetical protein KatS3mg110_1334 [Pirellulaceae bacterium]
MWCSYCQDDTPVVATQRGQSPCCAQCHQPLDGAPGSADRDPSPVFGSGEELSWQAWDETADASHEEAGPADKSQVGDSNTPPDDGEQLWKKWEDNLAELDELLWQAEAATASPGEASSFPTGSGHTLSVSQRDQGAAPVPAQPFTVRHAAGTWLGRILVAIGMTVFGAGAALGLWAFVGEQSGWWGVGLPLSLVGQMLLLVGLAVQVESTSAEQRAAREAVTRLSNDLERIERATTLLAGSHSLPAQSFYVHFAQRASPHILLADLKNQLDLLTMRLADHG